MPVETQFLTTSRSVVQAFLSTVVLVDDRAYFVKSLDASAPGTLIQPGKIGAERSGKATVSESTTPTQPPETEIVTQEAPVAVAPAVTGVAPANGKDDHTLDAKAVIDVFARIGVVCSVMRPAEEELTGLGDLVMSVGTNADVVILDWVLYEATLGQRTLDLIERLANSSAAESGRARLIVIYTAEPNLIGIEEKIRERLGLQEATPTNTLTITSKGTRICVYGKAGTLATPIGSDRGKEPRDLPEVVVAEFAEMTKGLLSNVAMKSITAIRAKTFQLLRRFEGILDASYVTQSTLISPERAEEQVAALIVSEIQEILEDEEVGVFADFAQIAEWLTDQEANGLVLPSTRNLPAERYREGLLRLVKNGVGEKAITKLKAEHSDFAKAFFPEGKKKTSMHVRESLTGILSSHLPKGLETDERFTMLMSLRHRYDEPAPQLSLGTILASVEDVPKYLLCLQPLCDSVRLQGVRSFAFLPLNPVTSSKKCDLIVEHLQKLQFLTHKFNPFLLQMISFAPTKDEKVGGASQGLGYSFRSEDGRDFSWVADLKPAHAQRMANNFASTFSRVGLYESEWNRLGVKNESNTDSNA